MTSSSTHSPNAWDIPFSHSSSTINAENKQLVDDDEKLARKLQDEFNKEFKGSIPTASSPLKRSSKSVTKTMPTLDPKQSPKQWPGLPSSTRAESSPLPLSSASPNAMLAS